MEGQGTPCSLNSLPPEAVHSPSSPVSSLSAPTPRRWRKVKKCAGTKELACSLMCLEKQDLYNKFKGRVWAVSPSARSPSVESKFLYYLFEGECVATGPGGRLPVQDLGPVALQSQPLASTSPRQRAASGSLALWQGVRGLLLGHQFCLYLLLVMFFIFYRAQP